MSKAKRVDKNQKLVVKQLRKLGYSVLITSSLGKGFPDFIIGFNNLFSVPVELKSEGGTLTKDEKDLHDSYKGYIIVAYSLEEILLGIHQFYERIYDECKRS